MWKRCPAVVDGVAVKNALVDFAGRVPEQIEWASSLPLNSVVTIGETDFYAGRVEMIGGMCVTVLMAEPLIPNPVHVAAVAAANAVTEAEIAAPAVPDQAKPKGKKK